MSHHCVMASFLCRISLAMFLLQTSSIFEVVKATEVWCRTEIQNRTWIVTNYIILYHTVAHTIYDIPKNGVFTYFHQAYRVWTHSHSRDWMQHSDWTLWLHLIEWPWHADASRAVRVSEWQSGWLCQLTCKEHKEPNLWEESNLEISSTLAIPKPFGTNLGHWMLKKPLFEVPQWCQHEKQKIETWRSSSFGKDSK